MEKGKMLIVSAPSGSGKSTIVQWLMKEHPELNLYFSISCTSRAPRGTEQNGVEYFFLTPEEFKAKIKNDEFLEYEEVYENRFYGTLKQQVENQRNQGQNVVFDVDVKGGVNIKKYYGDEALSLFIQPPSVDELRRRLVGRATDTAEAIEERLAKAEYEMTFASKFDHIIVNDDLETANSEGLPRLIKSDKFMKTGIFGGSFNPIHNGHIALAKAALEQCGLDEVWLMVSPQNPLKQETDLLADNLRYEMVQQALQGVDGIVASDYEFHLPKPSYTWNTLQHLSKDYPNRQFTLIIGGDNWAHFERWRRWKDILRHYNVAVYPRDQHIGTFDAPLLDVSSTEIRQRIASGEGIQGMVPDSIISIANKYYQ
jgi:guanylate kinase/nicotinate (nicotinamide) nucleotide adenylyltransferase